MIQRVDVTQLTPLIFLQRSADVFPERVAVTYGDRRISYAELAEGAQRVAGGLEALGVREGDRVAYLMPNVPEMLIAHYAVPLLRAVLVSINTRLAGAEIAYILEHSGATVLVADTALLPAVSAHLREIATLRHVVQLAEAAPPLELSVPSSTYPKLLEQATETVHPWAVDDELRPISINYTSGTTGRPKGVQYTHRGAYLNALGELLHSRHSPETVYLWTLPMFHCNGWCFTWAVTAIGGTHVCLRAVLPEDLFRLIESEHVTHMCAAPTVLVMMSNYPGAKNMKFKDKLRIMTAGAPPAPRVIENVEALGAVITHTYGLTEVFGPHSVCAWKPQWDALPSEDRAKLKSRQGVPYVVAQYMDVMDPATMQPVPRDGSTMGEIVMRGNNVMLGYYKDPQATETAFEGGWFHSGDLAVMHPDNYVQIMDRKKDIIISGGENISTVEIENVIFMHPDVLEAAVIPVPDEKWGEVPKAFVVPKAGRNPTAESIIDFCKQHLARFKAPKIVEFGPLPKTATGKIQKYKLREKEWQGRERKVN
jgi:fatty-acyl-CoA synthase